MTVLKTEPTLDLEDLPGFHIRRLQQIAVAIFLEETEEHGVTPVQYAAMAAVQRLEARVLRREAALARHVDDEQRLSAVL